MVGISTQDRKTLRVPGKRDQDRHPAKNVVYDAFLLQLIPVVSAGVRTDFDTHNPRLVFPGKSVRARQRALALAALKSRERIVVGDRSHIGLHYLSERVAVEKHPEGQLR